MLRVLHLAGVLFCAVLVVWPLAGCGTSQADTSSASLAPSSESPPDGQPQSSLSSQPADDQVRLPLENTDYKKAELQNYETIGAQFFQNDKRYYRIASAIYRYRDYHNALIFEENLSDITQADPAFLVEIAASQAPHIDLYSAAFRNLPADCALGKFFKQKKDTGIAVGLLSYGDDVRAKAKELFGEDYELPKLAGLTIRYDADLDLYYLNRDGASLATDYPVIIGELKTSDKDGCIAVKVLRLCYWDFNGIWSTPDGSWESGKMTMQEIKNYAVKQIEAGNQQFMPSTYYLQETDGGLRVVGFQKA